MNASFHGSHETGYDNAWCSITQALVGPDDLGW